MLTGDREPTEMGRIMAEHFNTAIVLEGEDARKFREYEKNPWVNETKASLESAKRARAIASNLTR